MSHFQVACFGLLFAAGAADAQSQTPWRMATGPLVPVIDKTNWRGVFLAVNPPHFNHADWTPAPQPAIIGLDIASHVKDPGKALTWAKITYFEAFVHITNAACSLRIQGLDAAATIKCYNPRHPKGFTLATLRKGVAPMADGETLVDLSPGLAPGWNRVVVIHSDDTGPRSQLLLARFEIESTPLTAVAFNEDRIIEEWRIYFEKRLVTWTEIPGRIDSSKNKKETIQVVAAPRVEAPPIAMPKFDEPKKIVITTSQPNVVPQSRMSLTERSVAAARVLGEQRRERLREYYQQQLIWEQSIIQQYYQMSVPQTTYTYRVYYYYR